MSAALHARRSLAITALRYAAAVALAIVGVAACVIAALCVLAVILIFLADAPASTLITEVPLYCLFTLAAVLAAGVCWIGAGETWRGAR